MITDEFMKQDLDGDGAGDIDAMPAVSLCGVPPLLLITTLPPLCFLRSLL